MDVASNHTRLSVIDAYEIDAGASNILLPLRLRNPEGAGVDWDATVLAGLANTWADISFGGTRYLRAVQAAAQTPPDHPNLTLAFPLTGGSPPEGTPVTIMMGPGFFAIQPPGGGNIPPDNNTITNPGNVPVDISIPGLFAQNIIEIVSNGTGLPVTIRAKSLINSTIKVMDGDALDLGDAASVNVNSVNQTGGITVTSFTADYWPGYVPPTASYSEAGTATASWEITGPYADPSINPWNMYIYLNAATSGTLDVTFGHLSGVSSGYWYLDGVLQGAWNAGGGGSVTGVPISRGAHKIVMEATSWENDGLNFTSMTLSGWPTSAGFLVEQLGSGTLVQVGGTHSNSDITLNGDSLIVTGNLQNSTVTNQSNTVTNDTVNVTGDMTNSTVTWFSPLQMVTGSLAGATVQVNQESPTNLSVPGGIYGATITVPPGGPALTSITYQTITGNLTTTTTQSSYLGTDWAGVNGSLIALAEDTTVLGAGATYGPTAWFQAGGLSNILATVFSDQSGTLNIEWSSDGVNADVISAVNYTGGTNKGGVISQVVAPYVRFSYVNGSTAQTTFRFYAWGQP